jgi:hypothetical protein
LQKIKNKTIRRQAIHNIIIQHNKYSGPNRVNAYKSLIYIKDAIFEFIWDDTIEGKFYWSNIYHNIKL